MHPTSIIIAQPGATVNIHNYPAPAAPTTDPLPKITDHKRNAQAIQAAIAAYHAAHGQPIKAARIEQCGSYVAIQAWQDPDNTRQLASANFCRHPLCPMCAWRRSLAWGQRLTYAADTMAASGHLYSLTLTIRNTPTLTTAQVKRLKQTAVKLMRQHLSCPDYILGLEITHSPDRGYHPHIHALLWTSTTRDTSYDAIAALRAAWGAHHREPWLQAVLYPVTDTAAAAAETAKYLVKLAPSSSTPDVISTLAAALAGQRKIQAAGRWRLAIAAAKAQIAADAQAEDKRLSAYPSIIEYYVWLSGMYRQTATRWAGARD